FGAETGLRLLDGFHTGYAAFGAIAPVDVDRTGLARPGWLRRLATLPQWRGLPVLLLAWVGIVLYDGLAASAAWRGTFGALGRRPWFGAVALLTVVAVAVAGYLAAANAAVRAAGPPHRRAEVAGRFAPALAPVALGLLVSRYLGVLLFRTPLLVTAA